MKFWLTYLFRYVFRRSVFVPVHYAGDHSKWAAVRRSTRQIHTSETPWSLADCERYCHWMNSAARAKIKPAMPDSLR